MSDSILSLLADELDTSPEKAQKLLIAMLREVKKRARREGVRLPNLGTFREADGEITFDPSPSLARAVNHRFEGLESEDLGTAPDPATDEDEDDDGPNTITLGYQDSDWTPLDAEEDSEDGSDEDTEEFQVPAAEEAADTDEFEVPESDPASDAPAEPEDSDDAPQPTETEELYPLVEDVPDGSDDEADATASDASPAEPADTASEASATEEEHDSLSGIWDDEEQAAPEQSEEDFDPFEAKPTASSEPPSSPSDAPPDAEESAAPAPDAAQQTEGDQSDREPTAPPAKDDDASSSGSVGARLGVGLLAVLLLGGAAWYVLGRQGTVQPPRQTFAQVTTQLQSQMENLSGNTAPPAEEGSSAESSEIGTPPSATAEVETGASASTGASTTDAADNANASSASNAAPSSPRELTPSAGGWTVVVASRTQRGPAESLVDKYRTSFAERRLPVGILTSVVDGQTRYRVGVGQFDSRSNAQQLLEEAGGQLPQGAWPLRLQ